MVDRLACAKNQVRLLEQVNKELDEELHKAIEKNTAQGIIISTREVSISQQAIQIKKLQARIDQPSTWDSHMIDDSLPFDSALNSEVLKLENKIDQLVGRKEYIATNVSDIYREKYPSVFQPVPYPYTHPIRDISAGGGKVKK